jgi:hypothetical protein
MEYKFKVGDKVKIAGGSEYYSDGDPYNPKDTVGVIKGLHTIDFDWRVTWGNGRENCYNDSDLVLAEYTPKDIKEPGKVASDGGPSTYYDFPEGCSTLNDLIEYKGMSFAQGNIFKAAYRLGNKEGISLEYDLKKIKYYADRMLAQIEKETKV